MSITKHKIQKFDKRYRYYFYRLHDLNSDKFLDGNEMYDALLRSDPKNLIRSNNMDWQTIEAALIGLFKSNYKF